MEARGYYEKVGQMQKGQAMSIADDPEQGEGA